MRPTTEDLTRFVGGQMEIQNSLEGYIFRGEIGTIEVVDGTVNVHFAWLAKGEGYPPVPTRWVVDTELDYTAGLDLYAYRIEQLPGGGERGVLQSAIMYEIVLLLLPNAERKLEKHKVFAFPKS